MKQNNPISGEEYCLSELFSGDNDKIVIPDLQRDYCWGSSEKDLVGKFMDTIISLDWKKGITMGIIYGYINEDLTKEHIQLCDGQQRLTTLFLLLGIINRKTSNSFSHILMSSFEDNEDDQEPYLQYSIRESSLYFLSDLTKHYFFSENLQFENLNKQPWYLNSYDQDPTIISLIKAIKKIEDKLEEFDTNRLKQLGDFVSNKLKFLYYDMDNRRNGEETFVVINTTGEPLSANQNLKPLVISESNRRDVRIYIDGIQTAPDKVWENMETWFWQQRNKKAKTHTADEGLTAFLQCAALISSFNSVSDRIFSDDEGDDSSEKAQEKLKNQFDEFSKFYDLLTNPVNKDVEGIKYSDIPLDKIWNVFLAYQKAYLLNYSERGDDGILYSVPNQTACGYTQKQLYVILPVLKYCEKFPNTDDENVKRIHHIFQTMSSYKDLSRPLTPTLRALISISEMEEEDPICLKDTDEFSKYYPEECEKLEIIWNNKDNGKRKDLEITFSKAESHPIFVNAKDSIHTLIEWGENDFEKISKYFFWFSNVWTRKNWGNSSSLDDLRRALLTLGLKNYPLRKETLCLEAKDWYTLITYNSDSIKKFLEKINDEEKPSSLSQIIDDYLNDENVDVVSPLYPLIKERRLMRFCEQKNVTVSRHTVEVLSKIYRSADYKIIYNGIIYDTKIRGKDHLRKWTDNILFVDFDRYNLTVDYIYDDDGTYHIIVWPGKYKEQKAFTKLDVLAKQFPQMKPNDKGEGALALSVNESHQKAHDMLYEVLKWIEDNK